MGGRAVLGAVLVVVGAVVMASAGLRFLSAAPSATDGTPTSGPTPTTITTIAPATASPTASVPAASPTPDSDAMVRAFFESLASAIRNGSVASLADRLHPAVIDRYGADACAGSLAASVADPNYAVQITAILPLAAWDYTTDDRTTTIPSAWEVDAKVTATDPSSGQPATADRVLHVAPVDGQVRWFSDCGTPLP